MYIKTTFDTLKSTKNNLTKEIVKTIIQSDYVTQTLGESFTQEVQAHAVLDCVSNLNLWLL